MLLNSETRQRHAFIERSIKATQAEFAHNQHLQARLGDSAVYFAGLWDRLFVPTVRNDQVHIPRRHRDSNGIPIIALDPNDHDLHLGEEFALFYPLQRQQIRKRLGGWGIYGARTLDCVEGDIQARVRREATESPHRVPNEFASRYDPKAFVAQPSRDFVLGSPELLNAGSSMRTVHLRPLMVLRYEGRHAPPAPIPAFVHEGTHIAQAERDMLHATVTDLEARKRMVLAAELEAFRNGAMAVVAQIQAGTLLEQNLTDYDNLQIVAEARRREINSPDNPYDPNDAIRDRLAQHGVHLAYPTE